MAGIGFIIPENGPGTGPVIPVPLHPIRVPGLTHRYVAERLELEVGATVALFPDQVGTLDLRETTAGLSQLIVGPGPGGVGKVVRTPNVVVPQSGQQLITTPGPEAPKTMAVVYRYAEPGSPIVANGLLDSTATGMRIGRAGNGNTQVSSIGTNPTGFIASTGTSNDGWRLAIASFDRVAEQLILDVSGVAIGPNLGRSDGAATGRLGLFSAVTSAMHWEIAEALTFDAVLTEEQRQQLRADLKAHYPVII